MILFSHFLNYPWLLSYNHIKSLAQRDLFHQERQGGTKQNACSWKRHLKYYNPLDLKTDFLRQQLQN